MQDISGLTVFSKEHEPGSIMLCGLRLRYIDHSEVILGEDCDEYQKLILNHPIRSICVHHIQSYGTMKLVTGLRFGTGHEDVNIGDCENGFKDDLQIDEVRVLCYFKRLANRCSATLSTVLGL